MLLHLAEGGRHPVHNELHAISHFSLRLLERSEQQSPSYALIERQKLTLAERDASEVGKK
jgi:hypothetical protein